MNPSELNILLIDDNEIDRKAVLRIIKNQVGYKLAVAISAEEGIDKLKCHNYDVILLDFRLANVTGLDVLDILNKEKRLIMPVIMLSGVCDEVLRLKCLEHGAQDFLPKDELTKKMLIRAIQYARERKNLQQQLLSVAKTDPLTGLCNRDLFLSALNKMIAKATRHQAMFAVLFIDLDEFKKVNDTLGHPIGDLLLVSVAERLQNSLREEDFIARIGGDEFAIIIDDLKDIDSTATIARHIIETLSPVHHCSNIEILIGLSIGISIFPECGSHSEELIQAADIAMYEVKKTGKNNFRFFSKVMQNYAENQLDIEIELSHALDENELSLCYQPQVDVLSQQVIGVEALLRWNSKKLGLVTPSTFIPIAEKTGLIKSIGAWVLLAACKQNIEWHLSNEKYMSRISIKVSLAQIKTDEFLQHVMNILEEVPFPPQKIVLELTEGIFLDDVEEIIVRLDKIHSLGVLIAIDNFGTGYLSLNNLRKLPVDILKVDQSFICDIGESKEDEAIVKTVIQLAHNLKIQVIAEGVETQKQIDFLTENKCDILQGDFFGQPMKVKEVSSYINGNS